MLRAQSLHTVFEVGRLRIDVRRTKGEEEGERGPGGALKRSITNPPGLSCSLKGLKTGGRSGGMCPGGGGGGGGGGKG